ncbi:hypothetical protein ACFQ0M_48040 [Kitasatospora aburaviensis]
MAEFTPVPGLENLVAAMVAPEVGRIGDKIATQAKRLAPPTKQWVTVGDDRVRHTHVQTEGQTVPNNLRFKVPSMDWDRRHRGLGAYTYMKAPATRPAAPSPTSRTAGAERPATRPASPEASTPVPRWWPATASP